MNTLLELASLALIGCLLLGLVPVLRGRTTAERLLGAQLMGTTGVGLLLLLGALLGRPALVDVALVLGLLAAVAVVALTRRVEEGEGRDE